MAVPKFHEFFNFVLLSAKDHARKVSDLVPEAKTHFNLSEDDFLVRVPSGKQTRVYDRISWARTYLKRAGLVRDPRRGYFELTGRGEAALSRGDKITLEYLQQFPEFVEFRTVNNSPNEKETQSSTDATSDITPEEKLLASIEEINDTLASSLLQSVREMPPSFFEQLIVDLLLAMGYGGNDETAGRALGQSGDNGVDGVIDQDPLGVDQVYIQAKRYALGNNISASSIRDFFGALNLKRATKGIFFTTSAFTADAINTRDQLGQRIVLIDGTRLAELMITYGIGCRVQQIFELKEFDHAYFDID